MTANLAAIAARTMHQPLPGAWPGLIRLDTTGPAGCCRGREQATIVSAQADLGYG